MCGCKQPLPHPPAVKGLAPEDRAVWVKHGKWAQRVKANQAFWPYLTPDQRKEFTSVPRAAQRARREAQWLLEVNPRLRTVLGDREALRRHLVEFNRVHRPSKRRLLPGERVLEYEVRA